MDQNTGLSAINAHFLTTHLLMRCSPDTRTSPRFTHKSIEKIIFMQAQVCFKVLHHISGEFFTPIKSKHLKETVKIIEYFPIRSGP